MLKKIKNGIIMKMIKIVLILSLILTINSCKLLEMMYEEDDDFTAKQREKVIEKDATPPLDYSPIFITSKRDIKDFEPRGVQFVVSGIDTRKPNSIKVRAHIIEGNDTYLAGGNNNIKNLWCEVVDSTANGDRKITNYSVREITEEFRVPVALAVVLDHSGSMGEKRALSMQDAVSKLISEKKEEDILSIIKYDGKVNVEVNQTNSTDILKNGFKKTGLQGYGGLTAVTDAIAEAIVELRKAPNSIEKSVVVFTDGFENSSKLKQDSVIAMARAENITIYAVDFGTNINPDFMVKFAELSGGFYHHIYKTEEFDLVFRDIYFRMKNFYEIEMNPEYYGVHNIRFKLCLPAEESEMRFSFDNTPDIGAIGLLNIYFDFDKATVKKESNEAIEAIESLMKAFPDMTIEIRGHTDSKNGTKDPDYNVKLSQRRADAVKDAIAKKGIDDSRIKSIGFGEKQPIADNETAEGRALNRRTEFIVLTK